MDDQIDSQPVEESADIQPQQDSQPVDNTASIPSQPQPSAWDAFKKLPEFQGQDDRAIAGRLYQSMQREQAASRALQQYQQVMPIAQEYLANRKDFDAWRQSRSQQAPQQQQPQPEKPRWWSPPEVKETYKRYLTKDENGREIIHPDAPIDARAALEEAQQYKADFAKKFLANPEEALGPMVQDLAAKQAQQIIEETMKQRDNEQFVDSLEKSNADWLFDPETGNVTPEGLLVHKYIEEAKSLGIANPKDRWEHAVGKVERDLLARWFDSQSRQGQAPQYQQQYPQYQQAPPVAPPAPQQPPAQPGLAQQNMEYLRREASRNPSRSAGTTNTDPRAPKQKMSFEQMLSQEASAKGFI